MLLHVSYSKHETFDGCATQVHESLVKLTNCLVSVSGDGGDMRPVLTATLADLKALRTILLTSSSDVDEKIKELESVKEENAKLKYQIKHLIRSLEAEEK